MKEEFKEPRLSENSFTENFINHYTATINRGLILTHRMIKKLVSIRQYLITWDNKESYDMFKCIELANLHTVVDIERQLLVASELFAISGFLSYLRQDVSDRHALYQRKEKIYRVLEECIQKEHGYCQVSLVILMLLKETCPSWEEGCILHLIFQAMNQLNREYNICWQRKSASPKREQLFCSLYQRIDVLQGACTQSLLTLSAQPALSIPTVLITDGNQKHWTAPMTVWDNRQKNKRKIDKIQPENSMERHHHKPFE